MSRVNQHVMASLEAAQRCIEILTDMGATVTELRAGARNVVIHVDRAPAGVTQAWCSQQRHGATVVREMVTHIQSCEVRWRECVSAEVMQFPRRAS